MSDETPSPDQLSADAWRETAAQESRNSAYYRELLDAVAASLGPAVFVCDDGSRSDEPLRAKIPELVTELAKELHAFRDALAEGPWVNPSDVDDSTLLEWFLPNARLCVWIEGAVPPESSWSYAEKSGRIRSGGLVPRTESRE